MGEGLAGYREQDTDGGEADEERRAAGAQEGQRYPGYREQHHDHADVDEGLQGQPRGYPGGQKRTERIGRGEGDSQPAIGEEQVQPDHDQPAQQAELLRNHREHEVVLRRRQLQRPRLPALAEPDPEHAAQPERKEPLHGVKTDPLRVRPRVEESLHAGHLVRAVGDDVGDRRDADRQQQHELADAPAGDEEHRERGQRQHARRAEVRLGNHEQQDRPGDEQERQQAVQQ